MTCGHRSAFLVDVHIGVRHRNIHVHVIRHSDDVKGLLESAAVRLECSEHQLIGGSEIFLDEYSCFINYDDENCKPDEVKMEVYSGQIPEWAIRFMLDTKENGGYRYIVGDGFYWIFGNSSNKVLPGDELWLGKGVDKIFGTAPEFLYVSLKYA